MGVELETFVSPFFSFTVTAAPATASDLRHHDVTLQRGTDLVTLKRHLWWTPVLCRGAYLTSGII